MFDLMPNIWSSDVVVKTFWIVFYNNLAFTFTLIFPFDKLFFNIVIPERFNK